MNINRATIYTLNECPNCDETKNFISDYSLSVEIVNMDANPEARSIVKSMGFRQAPVVILKGDNNEVIDSWSGHNEMKLATYLNPSEVDIMDDADWDLAFA